MLDHFIFLAPLLLLPVLALFRFIGCTAFGATPAPNELELLPGSVDLGPGQSQPFTALVNGALSTDVIWSSNAPNGLFKAPDPFIPGSGSVMVTATSKQVQPATGSATVNLKHVTISVFPPAVSLLPGASQKFTAIVQGSSDVNVTWTAADASGTYTAPAAYNFGAPPVSVTATSQADPSENASASVALIGNGAKFIKIDSTTIGSWQGIYGAAGWLLAESTANLVNLPGYLSPVVTPPAVYPFADPTADPRGLQKPPAFTDRFAATWFDSNAMTIELDFLDFQIHRVAAYFIDWDSLGRAQTIEILDSQVPPLVLDTQNLADFSGGKYLVWNVTGKVLMKITKTGGLNAVISGLFFD